MKEKFSMLDPDKKTYKHFLMYYKCMTNNEDILKVDNLLQEEELKTHLEKCGKGKDKEECVTWICKNAVALRSYINALKIITVLSQIDSMIYLREEISFKLFCKIVEAWDLHKHNFIESIRINGD